MKCLLLILLSVPCSALEIERSANAAGSNLTPDSVTTTDDVTVGDQLTVKGTATVQGNAFSVGTSSLVVSSGKIGVGTASPGMLVEGVQKAYGISEGISIRDSGNNTSLRMYLSDSGTAKFDAGGSGADVIALQSAGTGRLGIGVATPGNKVEIVGATEISSSVFTVNGTASSVVVGSMTIKGSGAGLPQGVALCITSTQTMGYCTTAALPSCTCVDP